MIRKLNWLIILALSICFSNVVCADKVGYEKNVEEKKFMNKLSSNGLSSQDELKNEISFLAQKLLDDSGKDTISISQDPYMKPFIGICSSVEPDGVRLTCITPGQSAEAAGLRTGDLVVKLNDIKLMARDLNAVKRDYFGLIAEMKAGEILSFTVYRGAVEKVIDLKVGELSQPGYTMTIHRR